MSTGDVPGRAPRRATAAQGFQVTACIAAVLMIASLAQFLPARAMPRPVASEGSAMSVLWPQGWNFYASEPTQPAVVAYRVADGGGLTAITVRQMSVRTNLGLNREGSAQLVELGDIGTGLPAAAWQGCTGLDARACQDTALARTPTHYRDATSHATLCGHTLIVIVHPHQWAAGSAGRSRPEEWEFEECANVSVDCV